MSPLTAERFCTSWGFGAGLPTTADLRQAAVAREVEDTLTEARRILAQLPPDPDARWHLSALLHSGDRARG